MLTVQPLKRYEMNRYDGRFTLTTSPRCTFCKLRIGAGLTIELTREQAADLLYEAWRKDLLSR